MSETDGGDLGNSALLVSMGEDAASLIRERVACLNQLEKHITLADRILRMSQPPMPGKIGVQWWKFRGRDEFRTPVLVRWRPLRGGRWRAYEMKQVHRKMLLNKGSATLCMDDTWEVVQEVKRMIRVYTDGLREMRGLPRRLNTSHQSMDTILMTAGSNLYACYRSVETKLVDGGYTMDGRTGELVRALLNPSLD